MDHVYIQFDKDNKFASFNLTIKDKPLPDNAVVITDKQHAEYLAALNSQIKDVVLAKGKIKIVDKFTKSELAAQEAEQKKALLIAEAKTLLLANDYRWNNKIKWERYDEKTRAAIMKYYDALVAVVNGESENIPELEI